MTGNLQQVMSLIDELDSDEKKLVFKKMNHDITDALLDILDDTNQRAQKNPVSMEEITEEVEAVRKALYNRV
jgi:dsDNA-binding SOS-regulon protein